MSWIVIGFLACIAVFVHLAANAFAGPDYDEHQQPILPGAPT